MRARPNPYSDDEDDFRGRHLILIFAVAVLFLMLLTRVWYLQIIRGHEFRTLSESNRTRVQDIPPVRGLILDRDGRILANNIPSYELSVIREDIADAKELASRLAYLLSRPYSEIVEALESIRYKSPFEPVRLLSGLTREELVRLETHRFELPGVVLEVKPKRVYLHDRLASHVIGYLGQVTENQLKQDEYREHRMGDLAGMMGLERGWEQHLHGKRGRRLIEVDAGGRLLKVITQEPPIHGHNIELTLDSRLQRLCQEALGSQAGAVAAVDPRNGEVLALASMPTFNSNDFVDGISTEKWRNLIENPLHPMEHRAVAGKYPPGSTFKIVSATAALEDGAVKADEEITCSGHLEYGDRVFHCWNWGGHGPVTMHRSLKESCDVYYYEVGLRVGVDRLSEWAHAFGLGQKMNLGLPNEKEGLFPNKAWKLKRFKRRWMPGETLSVVIGQGYIQATPLQMAQVTAVAANGGKLYRSRLVRRITDSEGKVVREFGPEIVRDLHLKPETVEAIQKGLVAVVNEPGGTASRARLENVTVAGKTGTSQVVGLRTFRGYRKSNRPYKYRDHAWFVAYAPAENPTIAVAVVIEHGGHGGTAAAPIAREVIRAYLDKSIKKIESTRLPKPDPLLDWEEPGP